MSVRLDSTAIRAAFSKGELSRTELEAIAKTGDTKKNAATLKKLATAAGVPVKDLFHGNDEGASVRSLVATLLAEPRTKVTQLATSAAQSSRSGTLGFTAVEHERPKSLLGRFWQSVLGNRPSHPPLMGLPDGRQSKTVASLLDDETLSLLRKARNQPRPVVVGEQRYAPSPGGPVDIAHGAVVEGSIDFGGIQPHYVVDLTHPSLQKLFQAALKIGSGRGDTFDKVQKVVTLVQKTLTDGAYDGPRYLALLEAARDEGRNVSLGDYIDVKSGVCRENALLTHVLLKAAGIQTHYSYAVATQGEASEDHAVCLLPDGDRTWVVDSYNSNFHGMELSNLMKKGGTQPEDPRLPGSKPPEEQLFGCALALAAYPLVWNPVA